MTHAPLYMYVNTLFGMCNAYKASLTNAAKLNT